MRLTQERGFCQHCAERPARFHITWVWPEDTTDEEDWCEVCAESADNYSSMEELPA